MEGIPINGTRVIILILVFLVCFPCALLADDTTAKTIRSFTLEQKVGQILMIGFHNKSLSKKDISLLRKIRPGGIVFYARNFGSVSDLHPLIEEIKKVLEDEALPVFFAIDQEGGIVHRIEGEQYKPPSAPAIGAANSEDIAMEVGFAVGGALKSLGINVNLAPVLDMPADIQHSTMTLRSFSNKPEIAARLGVAYLKGLRKAGVLSVAKHFPGIGRASGDTHETLLHVVWNTDQEKENDMMPFMSAIKAGVDMLMAGHVIAEPGDTSRPVSLSLYWLHDVLRKEKGFRGLVLADNIEMKPVQEMMDIGTAAVESFQAGADIIMVSHEQKNQATVFEALLKGFEKGTLSHERLEESILRIVQAKKIIRDSRVHEEKPGDLRSIVKTVHERSVIALRLKDTPPFDFKHHESILYVGFNTVLFDALKTLFKKAEMMNSSSGKYQAMNFRNPVDQFIKRFDIVLIDSNYPDISELISLCDRLAMHYIIFQNRVNGMENTLETIKPKAVIVLLDSAKYSCRIAAEIIRGVRKTSGILPFQIPSAAFYTLF
ncbi:MAG: glycoside hydrolase family 3 N-terminal domain-containing protein [Thermodesulfovibrionales bacterium]|nr:glycoside hydrolase family 3 N-terminal domain-containing protein [Thermodesulfovibrionales bacterium]